MRIRGMDNMGMADQDPATQTLNEQIALTIYPNAAQNKAKIRKLVDDRSRQGDEEAKMISIGITQAGAKGIPYWLTEAACQKVAATFRTLPDWTFTAESIPAPFGFCRLAVPIQLVVPPGQVAPRITAFAWWQFSSFDVANPKQIKVIRERELPAGTKTHERIGVVFLHQTADAPHGIPGYALVYRLNRSFFEHTNSLAHQGDPAFAALDERNRYVATVFALLQQQQLHTEQQAAARWLTDAFKDLLTDLKRNGLVTIIDIPRPAAPPPPPGGSLRKWLPKK